MGSAASRICGAYQRPNTAQHFDSNGNSQNGKEHAVPKVENHSPRRSEEAVQTVQQNKPGQPDEPGQQQPEDLENPVETETATADRATESSQKDNEPSQQEAELAQVQDKPAEDAGEPVQNQAELAEEAAKPVEDASKLVEEPAEPVQKEAEPVEEPGKPVEEPDKPYEEPGEPVEGQAKSVEQTGMEKATPVYTKESLLEFLSLEQKLGLLEKKNIVGEYQTRHSWLVSRYENLQAAQKKVEQLKQQTAKEYQDITYMQHPNVRAMFSNVYQLQSQMAKEQQEYMDALNRQEVAEKELKGIQQEYNSLYAEVDSLRKDYEQLTMLSKQEEETLNELFGGKYGSKLEEQLEMETDLLNERKDVITATRNRWCNAKVLMQHAFDQLRYSTRRWAQINTVSREFVQARYSMVAETRNYLIAASQNITNTHRFFGNIVVPYCNSEDLKVLNNAITSIFNDIMNIDSYNRSLQTYNTLYNRAGTLLQWINLVLEQTINKDLEKIIPEYRTKLSDLKRERLRLIHVKMRELQGGDGNDDIPEAEIEPEAEQEPIPEAGKEMHIAEPDAVSLKECEENKDDVPPPPTTDESATDESAERPSVGETEDTSADGEESETAGNSAMKPKPLTELAPIPAQDVLFGNIEELKTKYEKQVAEFSKAQDVNKARVDQALQDKLRARRSRRKRVELQQLETSQLANGVTHADGSGGNT